MSLKKDTDPLTGSENRKTQNNTPFGGARESNADGRPFGAPFGVLFVRL